jgi:mono/diheme cytochrome c family protein
VRRWRRLAAAALMTTLGVVAAGPMLAKAPRKKTKTKTPAAADFDVKLPVLGTSLQEYPAGSGKAVADVACLQCHSASMGLQQRLTEKQWTASVEKMMRWGAAVPADKKAELIAYLVANFGPDNDKFEPPVTRPVGK